MHHRGADRVDAVDHQRVDVVVERIAKRRDEQHRAGGARLVMVVDDLREPLAIQHAVHVLRLGLSVSVEIAVVVVADVFLIEARQSRQRPVLRILVAHVPVGDQVHAVGIGVNKENDDVIENAQRLLIVEVQELVNHLVEHLGAQRFGRVQPAVYPHDRLALGGKLACLGVADPLRLGQALGDFLIAV